MPHTAKNNLYMMSSDGLLPSNLMRAPIDLLTTCMMVKFNIGQKVSIRSWTDIVTPTFSGIALGMIYLINQLKQFAVENEHNPNYLIHLSNDAGQMWT